MGAKGQANMQLFNPADYKARGEATWLLSEWKSVLTPPGLLYVNLVNARYKFFSMHDGSQLLPK